MGRQVAQQAVGPGVLTIGEFHWYQSCYGHQKMKAPILKDGEQIGWLKAEPVMNGQGKQVSWVYYSRAPYHAMMTASPTQALALLQGGAKKEAEGYPKAKDFVPHIGRKDATAIDVKAPRKKK